MLGKDSETLQNECLACCLGKIIVLESVLMIIRCTLYDLLASNIHVTYCTCHWWK